MVRWREKRWMERGEGERDRKMKRQLKMVI